MITVTLKTNTPAFDCDFHKEVYTALNKASTDIGYAMLYKRPLRGPILDTNRKKIGSWKLTK